MKLKGKQKIVKQQQHLKSMTPERRNSSPTIGPVGVGRKQARSRSASVPGLGGIPKARKYNPRKDPNLVGFMPRHGIHRHKHQRDRETALVFYQAFGTAPEDVPDSDDEYKEYHY